MTKAKFIGQFLRELQTFGKEFWAQVLSRPYKGFSFRSASLSGFDRGIRNLQYRGILKSYGSGRYRFSKSGHAWLRRSVIRYHKSNGIKWDGKWRIVMFDIPREYNRERNKFRIKLCALGFHMLQRSIFAIPYPCDEDVGNICQQLGISNYVNMIVADSLGVVDSEVKKIFQL